MNCKDGIQKETLIAGTYPITYKMEESPIIRELGQAFSNLDAFAVIVWVDIRLYPDVAYEGINHFQILPDGALPDLDHGEVELYTVEAIPEGLRGEIVSLVASDMERFKEDGTLDDIAEEAKSDAGAPDSI